jgi:hypothetical protein
LLSGAELTAYYQNRSGCPVHGHTAFTNLEALKVPGIDENDYLKIYLDVKKNGKLHLNPDLFNFTRTNLIQAIEKVYPGIKHDHRDFDMVMQLRNNVSRFSGYKTAWQVSELLDQADDVDAINGLNKKYNTNWMRTEYEHTVSSTRAARNWQNYQADADLYPYLEYMPSTAGEPRNEHKKLYGVIKKLDDPFWDTWLPPADWGCKCSVQQRRSDKGTTQPPEDITKPPLTMRNNPGKDGVIFTDKHPMINKVSSAKRSKIDKFINDIVNPETEAPAFVPAKSIKEAEGYAKKYADDVDFAGLNLDSVNAINKRYLELQQKYKLDKLNYVGKMSTWIKKTNYKGSKKMAMGHDQPSNSIVFNPKSLKPDAYKDHLVYYAKNHNIEGTRKFLTKAKAPDEVIELHKLKKESNLVVSRKPDDAFTHEVGHKLHKGLPEGKREELDNLLETERKKYYSYLLSDYAWTNNKEFFAESFAAYNIPELRKFVSPKIATFIQNNFTR